MTTPGAYALELVESIPTEDMRTSAAHLREILLAHEGEEITVLDDAMKQHSLVLAPALSRLLRDILGHIEKGEGVTFIPNSKQLTTQQAADILNVSRPFLIKLLNDGAIAFTKTGRHRRIEARNVFAYKRARDAERHRRLDELIGLDQDLY
ncbi:MAG: excisionase family DNA-binding protein [Hyphomonas sp.]